MPLLKGRFLFPAKPIADPSDSEDTFVIPHTNERFKSKEEYEKRFALYNEAIWTCQCTGAIKLTHKEACESEKKVNDVLEEQFEKCYEKPVLKLVHHSTEILDNLTDLAWRKIHQTLCESEPVQLRIKSDGAAIDALVVKLDSDEASGYSNSSSPSSNKENKDEENKPKAAETDSPKKQGIPKLLSLKYTIKLSNEEIEKVISGVPAEDLVRVNRPPNKELIKLFIRAKAVRGGYQFNSPWVVEEDLVKKYSLPSKYADFLVSPAKMAELGKKALEEAAKCTKSTNKRRSSSGVSPAKKAKLDKGDKKQTTLKLNRGPGRPKGSTSPKKSISPKKSPKKAVATPQEESSSSSSDSSSSDSSSDDSSDEDEDSKQNKSQTAESPESKPVKEKSKEKAQKKEKKVGTKSDKTVKKPRPKPLKDGEKRPRGRPRIHPPKVKVLLPDGSPRKRGRPKKSDSPVKPATPGQTPTKPKTPKKMKQMTLFDMKGKKKDGTPKKGTPSKKKDGTKSPKKPASPYRLPPLASRLKKALDKGQKTTANMLTGQCARELSHAQIKKLPEELKSRVLVRYEVIQEKKRVEKMTPAEKEEYLKKKKEDMKKKLREKMKQRWIEQNKRFEDTNLDLKTLPVAKIAPTPDGVPNELFGDVALVTEFISCYRELLMPQDPTPVYTDQLMKSLAAGQSGFGYMSKVLAILLQTLLQDEIAEDYNELSTSLADIAVNQNTVSELVRLCLRKHDQDNSSNSGSDQQEDEQEEDEMPDGLVEQLESYELYELPAEAKLQILTGLCHRIMGSYSVQDYMETKQQEASELWRKRIASQKEKNDLLKEEKQKKKSAKKSGKEDTTKVKEEEHKEKDGLNIKSFYGQQVESSAMDEGDLASVVKSRRLHAAKAAEEKKAKEREERIRRGKEAEEQRRVKDFEALEKQFIEGTTLARVVLRQSPLGTDRHHNRYWLFHNSTPGIYVEKGWVNKDIEYCVRDSNYLSESSQSEDSSSDEDEQPKKRGRKKKAEHKNCEKTVPHTGQNLWFMYDELDDVNKLVENLNPMGIRESVLKKELTQNLEQISKLYKQREKSATEETPAIPVDFLEACRVELIDLEARLKNGGLGGVPDFTLWEKEVLNATTIAQLGELMIESQKCVVDKFYKGMMATKALKQKEKEENGMDEGDVKEEVKTEQEEVEEEKPDVSDVEAECEEVYPGIESWREAVRSCATWSRLHVLLSVFDSCIKWERSAENAKCKICRKKGDEDRLLLCDECNQPFHLYCLRPSLFEVPTEEWFCPACVPQSKRRCRRETNYRQMADYTDSEGSSDEEAEEEEEEIVNEENCAVCGGDEGIYGCSTCSSSFHLDCHEPPLRTAPRSSTWRCMQCKSGIRIRKKSSRSESRKRTRYIESDTDSDYEQLPKKKARTARNPGRPHESSRPARGRRSGDLYDEREYDEPDHWESRQLKGTASRPKNINGNIELEEEEQEEEDEKKVMLQIIKKMKNHSSGWPFKDPVDSEEVPDYYNIVKNPIELTTIESKCISDMYVEVEDFTDDIALMFDNAELYNVADSVVGKCTIRLEKFFIDQLRKFLPNVDYRRAPDEEEESDKYEDKSDSNETSLVNSDHAYC